MFVMRHDCSWLEISDEEKDQAFESFRDMSIHLLKSKTEVETESYREIRRAFQY
jgi:hypothetical protein